MKIIEIIENDNEHAKELGKTGFWGKQGAGCLILAMSTKRFCIAHRSRYVEQPLTWGTWGGAIDEGENPKSAAAREVREEAGYSGNLELLPLFMFKHASGFRFYNFLAIVEDEFTPKLDWENEGFEWVEFGKWPQPMHFGLEGILNDAGSVSTIKRMIGK